MEAYHTGSSAGFMNCRMVTWSDPAAIVGCVPPSHLIAAPAPLKATVRLAAVSCFRKMVRVNTLPDGDENVGKVIVGLLAVSRIRRILTLLLDIVRLVLLFS